MSESTHNSAERVAGSGGEAPPAAAGSALPVRADARDEAQKQWNARACGELDGEKNTLDYFLAVEHDRYTQQPWAAGYFGYDGFAGKKILEIGVGQGTDLAQFAKGGAICHAIDITDNHLELARRNFALRGFTADIRRADATRIPFPDGYFDAVYSFGVLHHIPEMQSIMAEVRRVLAPGGVVMLALYYQWSAFWVIKKLFMQGVLRGGFLTIGLDGIKATIEEGADGRDIKPYVKLYTRRSMREALAGFAVEDVSIHQFYADHVLPHALVRRWANRPLPLEGRFGWYVAARARKPA